MASVPRQASQPHRRKCRSSFQQKYDDEVESREVRRSTNIYNTIFILVTRCVEICIFRRYLLCYRSGMLTLRSVAGVYKHCDINKY